MRDSATRMLRWLPLAVFLYGSAAAYTFAFHLYARQGMVEATVDLNGFGALARNLAQGHGFSFGNGPTVRRAPLYPLLAAAALSGYGGELKGRGLAVYRPVILLNCGLFGLTCLTVWAIARRLFGPQVALLAAALCPFVPQAVRYMGMTEVETLMGLLLACLALFGLQLAERPTLAHGACFGLTAAAAVLTKPVLLFYPCVFVVTAVWQWRRDGLALRGMAPAIAALFFSFVTPLVPWSLRNASVTEGRFYGISSNGPAEFLRGYINAQPKYYLLRQDFGGSDPNTEKWDPEANAYEQQLLAAHGVAYARCGPGEDGNVLCKPAPPADKTAAQLELQKDAIEAAEVKRRVLAQPLEFLHKLTVQLFTFWYVVETRKKSLLVGAIALTFLTLAALGVGSARRRHALVWPVAAVLLYVNAIYAVFLAFARYSMPLYPTLTALSAGGLAALAERALRALKVRRGTSESAGPAASPCPPQSPADTR